MVAAITYPERVGKFVMGGSHIGTGGDRYLMANRPLGGSRGIPQARDAPSRHYLRIHVDDQSLVTDELMNHRAHTWSPEFMEARRQSVSLPHDYTQGTQAPVVLIQGRYDWMVPFEVSIAVLNHIAHSRLVLLNNCGHWPPFEKQTEWGGAGPRLPAGLLRGDGWSQNPISSSTRRRVDHSEMRLGSRRRAVSGVAVFARYRNGASQAALLIRTKGGTSGRQIDETTKVRLAFAWTSSSAY